MGSGDCVNILKNVLFILKHKGEDGGVKINCNCCIEYN